MSFEVKVFRQQVQSVVFDTVLEILGAADILNLLIRWSSDTETSLVTPQSTMSCQMAVDDSDMSKLQILFGLLT
jgi:hypothetical protein